MHSQTTIGRGAPGSKHSSGGRGMPAFTLRRGGLTTAMTLADFPYFNYFTESYCNGNTDPYAKTSPENRIPRHRKTESHAAPAQERRCPHPRVPDRTRGRAAHRGLSGQSLAAPRPNHDPTRL